MKGMNKFLPILLTMSISVFPQLESTAFASDYSYVPAQNGSTVALPSDTRSGYNFLGWATDNTSTDPKYLPGDGYTVTANTTLNPVWIAKSYSLDFNMHAWKYDSTNNVYWQIGVAYCKTPETLTYETLGIYVPRAYMTGTANGDGTYTCAVNTSGIINGYTAATAPMIIPVNTGGYMAQSAPTSYKYDDISSYMQAGFIYVQAGCRGCNNGTYYDGGAPWGVTDLKAAIRYLRYNADVLPGDTDRIFTFGHSGGGAQSSLVGATGDAKEYIPYLNKIGAAMTLKDGKTADSDIIDGAQAWCPITELDYADSAYEWMMGQYSNTGSRTAGYWTAALSNDLSKGFANYINELGLKDENGNKLVLTKTNNGIYTSGSYYNYLLDQIEFSLNNYLKDNYGTNYEDAAKYCASYNWIKYDTMTHTASISSVGDFVNSFKNPTKPVGAFDGFDRNVKKGIAENFLFGDHDSNTRHFNPVMADLLSKNANYYKTLGDASYSVTGGKGDITNYTYTTKDIDGLATDYQEYKNVKDSLGFSSLYRQSMYNPMYYLSNYYAGYNTSTPAAHWRINSGISQSDTSCTVEMNLALALKQYSKDKGDVKDVDLNMVWDQGHIMAERTGTSTTNFINWVNECCN
jgi:hypothetical protein